MNRVMNNHHRRHKRRYARVIYDLNQDWRNKMEERYDERTWALRRVYIREACAQVVPKNGIEVMNEWKWHTEVNRLKRYLRENNVDTNIKDKQTDLIRRLMSL